MTRPGDRTFWNSDEGAVAPTFVIASFALVAVMGVSFDYARLAVLDSELQAAADQAALAAATQLDGKSGAITRANSAADSLVQNKTIFANDGGSRTLSVATKTYYDGYTVASDTLGSTTTTDASAKVVEITLSSRKAFYALTPIIRVFNSGNLTAKAIAGVQSSSCKIPPLMICGPSSNPDFPSSGDIGKGLFLEPGSQGSWGPGMFGYVDYTGGPSVTQLLGANSVTDTCVDGATLTPKNGQNANAPDYLNTRFDIYTASLTPSSCTGTGDYCPAANTRKDLMRVEFYDYGKTTPTSIPACNSALTTDNSGKIKTKVTEWDVLPSGVTSVQGFPRDTCHTTATSSSNGTCSGGNFGDGTWDVAGYRTAHPNVPTTLITRYDIYKWERDNAGSGLQNTLAYTTGIQATNCNKAGNNCDNSITNYCSYPNPIKGTYHSTAKDRRVLTLAVADCSTAGKNNLTVKKWMDVFLTEPSWNRTTPYTTNKQIYAEVIGVATRPDGTDAYQYYARNKVVLYK